MPVHKELIMMLRSDQEARDFFLSFERDVQLQYPHQQSFEFFLLIKNTVILIKHVEIIQQVYLWHVSVLYTERFVEEVQYEATREQ